MVIDFHTHYFPDSIAARAIASLEQSSNIPARYDGTLNGLQMSMDKAGVDYSVILPIAVKPKQMHVINDNAIVNNRLPNLRSFGSVHPDAEDWHEELKRLSEAGIKGIKLHPDFQGIDLDDKRMVEVIAEAGQLGLIVIFHSGLDLSFRDYQRGTPKKLFNILPEIKGTKIVAAHSGGFAYLDDVEKYLVGKDDVYIDTSYSIGYREMPTMQLIRIYSNMSPDHILFGSDAPWERQDESIGLVRQLGLDESLLERIFYGNASKLLGL